MNENYCVICVGNVLLADEGVGPAVAAHLHENYEFPENVEVVDCGTLGLSLLPYFERSDYIVVVDSVDGSETDPGTLLRYKPSDIATRDVPPSAHDIRVSDLLLAAQMLGYDAEVDCIGIQIEDMSPEEFKIELTPSVANAVEPAALATLSLLLRAGASGIIRKSTGEEVVLDG